MKTTLILTVLAFFAACSHTPDEHRMERIEGVMHDHEIWEDPKTHLVWNRVPLPQNHFSEAEMVCSIGLKKKMKSYDMGMAKSWRLPEENEIREARNRGLRNAFNANIFWVNNTRHDYDLVYDKVSDRFKRVKPTTQISEVLCVAKKD